jgi:putative SOS response-associated peptidase YedK
MCANYTPTRQDLLERNFAVKAPPAGYDAEAYPGSMAPFVRAGGGGRVCEIGMFGLIPPWADTRLSRSTYNARAETVDAKPSFRDAWRNGQFCLIPAENLYEPCYESGKAVRWEFAAAAALPLAIAGLWTHKPDGPDGPLASFTMLTINADSHPLMRRMHRPEDEKRMVALLRPDQYEAWLGASPATARALLLPRPAEDLLARPAPRIVAAATPQQSLFD